MLPKSGTNDDKNNVVKSRRKLSFSDFEIRHSQFSVTSPKFIEDHKDEHNHEQKSTMAKPNDRLYQLHNDVDEVKEVMGENIRKAIANNQRAEDLVDRTAEMRQHSDDFRKGSTQLKRKMCWKNAKLTMIIVGIVLLIIVIIILAIVVPLVRKGGSNDTTHETTSTSTSAAAEQMLGTLGDAVIDQLVN
eukprot:TRINITY_DN20186_c0_g1_i1.p1 TRINITY_DN20186_c0_g1~~TRINITY_DN20186_c0_g1_i1.p1  ORF type:complete len:189 (+),score=36.04 TRINITY_DN20186_c0_g1_i1:34-600(+)